MFWSIRSKNLIAARTVEATLVLVACMCLGLQCDGAAQGPCSGGLDVRNIDDSGIPQEIKDAIYYDSGLIIGKYDDAGAFPSGKVVVIPFETPDFPRNPAVTTSYLFQMFFASGQLSGVSVAQYFLENSWGDFVVTSGGIADWVTLNKNLTSYVGFESEDDVPRDVLAEANINWATLDTNNDKTITPAEAQIVFIIANGYSAATRAPADFPSNWKTGDPWPPALPHIDVTTPVGNYKFKPPVVYIGVKTASDPTFDTNAIRIHSTICHELCHAFFNLTDRYAGPCGSGSTGQYDMMSDNCSWHHMNIHDKMKIGWIQPKIIAGHLDECLAFPASESTRAALVVLPPGTPQNPLNTDEYWIVENRNRPSSGCNGCVFMFPPLDKTGVFDAGLPESGLAVWWVKKGTWSSGHDDVRLIDADVPAQDPDGTTDIHGADPGYKNQGAGALHKRNDADPQHLLLNGQGGWSLLFFRDVSDPGSIMYAEF